MDSTGKSKRQGGGIRINSQRTDQSNLIQGGPSEIRYALNHERDLYLDLANALPLGIYRMRVYADLGTKAERWYNFKDGPYQIEFVNDRFCELLGLNKIEFIKNPSIFRNHIFEDDLADFVLKNVEANVKTIPFIWEGRYRVNGQQIWIHFQSIPRVLDNMDIIWTGFLEDITERKCAEELLQQKNNELQQLNAQKDKFFSIIAHDLKSPFNSIIGFSGILLEKVNEKDIDGLREYAEIITHSSQKAMNLLMNLMVWSHSQTGRMNFNPEYFDLKSLLWEVLEIYKDNAAQKSIHINQEISIQSPVYGDKGMLSTILRNLLSNALKFTPDGGNIQIIVHVSSTEVSVSIKDSGIGMKPALIEKLFRIDSSYTQPDTKGERGTGLGLVICKEFVDKHKGRINIESEPGEGSVFQIILPNKPMEEEQ